ncbi:MAG TPA: hypothetical protein VLS48_06990 [Anaerolineales bacterium]|nr:hypothetical protein [Anaerolineales bacterium]
MIGIFPPLLKRVVWLAGWLLMVGVFSACAPPQAIAAQETVAEPENRYSAELPAAHASDRTVTLELEPNGRAALLMDTADKGVVVQTGVWRAEQTSSGETRVIVSLTEQNGRQLDEMIVFEVHDDQLVAVAYDEFIWGSEGLTLNATPDTQ